MPGDIFATKGPEYLIVIVYLLVLVAMVTVFASKRPTGATVGRRPVAQPEWFALADGYHFHPGHTWAAAEDGELVTVGLDDFAAQLVGPPDAIELPAVGSAIRQGEAGWVVRAGERTLTMLSPVAGDVVAANTAVIKSPQLVSDDPYGKGWLLMVRAANRRASLRNLLSGELAVAWIRNAAERLRRMPAAQLGVLMTDGGMPVRGFARALGPEEWAQVVREFFLTD